MRSSAADNLGGAGVRVDTDGRSLPVGLGLATLGAAFGFSQTVHGFYDESTWAPIALGALVVLLAMAVGAPRRIPVFTVLPLLGLAVWSLLSSSWGDSADAAWSAADRWLLYALALALLLRWLTGSRRRAEALLIGATAGILLVALWTLLQMLTGHGASLFLGNRLNGPLGYVNGQAGYLLAGVWPCCALAERRRAAPAAGIGMAGLVLLVGLGALTRSRSWELGLAASALIVLAVLPGRRRRVVILLAAALAIFVVRGALSGVSGHAVTGADAARHAAVAIVIAGGIAGLGWAVACWCLERAAPLETRRRAQAGRATDAGLLVLALAAAALIGLNAGRISHAVDSEYHAFVHLAPTTGPARFLSGSGNRYDYWRVAWLEFRSAPVIGVGAGSYQPGYYRNRRTAEPITQPHSLEMQTLAELGLVGFALLTAFLFAVGVAIVRSARFARVEYRARATAVAASGLFVGWLTQTSADWEHLIPGLTLISVAAVAALHGITGRLREPLVGRAHAITIGAVAVIASAGVILVAPRILTMRAQSAARQALRHGDPRTAIRDATRALRYDGKSVNARVLRAAAFARLDAFVLARADLQHALATEPQNWVTWALLGDLLTRHGDLAAAKAAYRHARTLDPMETDLGGA